MGRIHHEKSSVKKEQSDGAKGQYYHYLNDEDFKTFESFEIGTEKYNPNNFVLKMFPDNVSPFMITFRAFGMLFFAFALQVFKGEEMYHRARLPPKNLLAAAFSI